MHIYIYSWTGFAFLKRNFISNLVLIKSTLVAKWLASWEERLFVDSLLLLKKWSIMVCFVSLLVNINVGVNILFECVWCVLNTTMFVVTYARYSYD